MVKEIKVDRLHSSPYKFTAEEIVADEVKQSSADEEQQQATPEYVSDGEMSESDTFDEKV